jgi:hypothetical protein
MKLTTSKKHRNVTPSFSELASTSELQSEIHAKCKVNANVYVIPMSAPSDKATFPPISMSILPILPNPIQASGRTTPSSSSGNSCSIGASSLASPNVPPTTISSLPSFSHGFRLGAAVGALPCPVSTVSGMSMMPGMGAPDWMSSTIWRKVGG